ncbi:MAG TPA: hypothetical protein VNK03_01025 [Gammaproteobacteria bacterium]|nr:hypothetical protein [Gammaproteobacteria bacterium]
MFKHLKKKIVHKALMDGIRLYKTIENFVKAVNEFKRSQCEDGEMLEEDDELTVSRVKNYLNRKDNIPFDDAVAMSYVTKINLKCFAPGKPMNKMMNKMLAMLNKNSPLLKLPVKSILRQTPECLGEIKEDRPVIIGTDSVTITGSERVEVYKASQIEHILVACIDLESLYLGMQTIENIGGHFLKAELGAIGLRIEQLLRTGQWCSDFIIEGRIEDYIAKILGFGSRDTYRRIKQICLQRNLELIEAVNDECISIKAGAKIAELPVAQQLITLQLQQKKNSKCKLNPNTKHVCLNEIPGRNRESVSLMQTTGSF